MNLREIVGKIDESQRSPGCGYYQVFVVGELVIKRYSDKEYFDKDVEKHKKLDGKGVIPAMVANFCDLYHMYLVVEKVETLDNAQPGDRGDYGYKHELFEDVWVEIEESADFKENLSILEEKLESLGYQLWDAHAGNFGYRGDDFVCLDEGCFVKYTPL